MRFFIYDLLILCITGSLFFTMYSVFKPLSEKYLTANWNYNILKLNFLLFFIPLNEFAKRILNLFDMPKVAIPIVFNIDSNTTNSIGENISGTMLQFYGKNDIFSVVNFIFFIWIIGLAFSILWQLYCVFKFQKQCFDLRKVTDHKILIALESSKANLKIKRNIMVFESKNIYSPMLLGLCSSKILLPNKKIPSEYLNYIFMHELTHFKRRDLLWKILSGVVIALFWFNPLIYILKLEFDKQLEYSCDEKVVDRTNFEDRKKYGLAILESVDYNVQSTKTMGICFSTPKQKLERRFLKMLKFKSMTKGKKLLSSLLVMVLLLITVTITAFASNSSTSSEFDRTASMQNISDDSIFLDSIINNTNSSVSKIEGYSFTEFKEWYELFKIQSEELVAQGIWSQTFSVKMQERYTDIISKIENDNGKMFGQSPEGSNEVFNIFYDTDHLIFQVPEEILEIDMNSPKWLVKIFPIK